MVTFHKEIEVEDVGIGIFKNSKGVLGLFEGTVNVFNKNLEETLYIFGQNGTIKISGKSLVR